MTPSTVRATCSVASLTPADVAVCDRAPQYVPARGNVASWLVVLVRNLSIDRVRRRQRRGRIAKIALAHEPVEPPADPEVLTRAERAHAALHRVLDHVPENHRQFLLATFFEGLTYDEVARRESIPLGTVKSRAARALASLREGFAREGLSLDDLL
jgi:RNA polymerase sigma-70 factor (ECF subfamily)